MKRLRTLRFRSYVLPVVLAALAARAFMPSGFMSTAGTGAAGSQEIEAQLCSLQQDRRSPVELPAEEHSPRCDHCLSPLGTAPIAFTGAAAPAKIVALLVRTLVDQVSHAPLLRTQLARAPPHA